MRKTFEKNSPRSGFSLVELLAVVVIFSLLVMMAAPSLVSIIPGFQLRRAAKSTSSLLLLARMTASNTQKPARAVVDCRTTTDPCRASIYTAVFNKDGELTKWTEMPNSIRILGDRITVNSAGTAVSSNPANLYWAVFMPSGKMKGSHDPMELVLNSNNQANQPWTISVSKSTGHVGVHR